MANKQKQIEQAERIQQMLLDRWEKMLQSEDISSTEVAVITKMLRDSGWTLDPTRLPQTIRDKLTANIDPKSFEDDDADVVGKIA